MSATTIEPSALLSVRQVAASLGCSPRTVNRLSDAGCMPRPRRLGSLVRWSRVEIETWIAGGCLPAQRARIERGKAERSIFSPEVLEAGTDPRFYRRAVEAAKIVFTCLRLLSIATHSIL
jgi:excisionase family DNA binding protein